MNQLRLTWLVAHWEVERLFKLRDLVVTLLITVLLAAGYLGVKALWKYSRESKARVAVLNAGRLPFQLPPGSGIELGAEGNQDEAALRAAVGRKELDGLLILHNQDEAELLVSKRPHWQEELAAALSAARQAARLQSANLSPPELAALLAPFQLKLHYHETGGKPFEAGEIIAAALVTGLLLLGIIVGSSYFLFLPFLPLSVGFIGLAGDPDTWVMRSLGIFPLTAPSVMFVRLVVTRVEAWEFLLSVGLLLGAIWLMRRAAGKIFALGMLLSGKEPGWREMWSWAKKA